MNTQCTNGAGPRNIYHPQITFIYPFSLRCCFAAPERSGADLDGKETGWGTHWLKSRERKSKNNFVQTRVQTRLEKYIFLITIRILHFNNCNRIFNTYIKIRELCKVILWKGFRNNSERRVGLNSKWSSVLLTIPGKRMQNALEKRFSHELLQILVSLPISKWLREWSAPRGVCWMSVHKQNSENEGCSSGATSAERKSRAHEWNYIVTCFFFVYLNARSAGSHRRRSGLKPLPKLFGESRELISFSPN